MVPDEPARNWPRVEWTIRRPFGKADSSNLVDVFDGDTWNEDQ
jgi:hypothetical protein